MVKYNERYQPTEWLKEILNSMQGFLKDTVKSKS